MKKNILLFWLGDETRKNYYLEKIKPFIKNSNLIIGPTTDEHDYLMKNYKYYKYSFNKKIYAFCSDVWRNWKLLEVKTGCYIDINTIINENFENFLDDYYINKKNVFLQEDRDHITNLFFLITNPDKIINKTFLDTLNFFKKNKRLVYTGPIILTKFLIKNKLININLKIKHDNFILLKSNDFDKRSLINKPFYINSSGSWQKNINAMKNWYNKWDNYNKSHTIFYRFIAYKFTFLMNIIFPIFIKLNKN